jgi:putative oxidoreductase
MTVQSEVDLQTIGRFIIGAIFVIAGLRHVRTFGDLAALLAARRFPFPRVSLGAGTIVQVIAGLAFALGLERFAAGSYLIVFTLSASVIAHNFWDKAGNDRTSDLLSWQANTAIVGGILLGMA